MTAIPEQSKSQPEFLIQRIYIKDVSFESPQAPAIFKQNVQPSINVNIQTTSNPLEPDHHEVVLTATITAVQNDQNVFLTEVKQAGIFLIKNVPNDNMGAVLGVTCPTILFPFLREAVSALTARGGFPNFYLSPINFEALYFNSLKQKEKSEDSTTH